MATKAQRELLHTPSGDRYIRRDHNGHFLPGQVQVGKSLAADNNQQAKTVTKPGEGDKGDHKKSAKKNQL